MANIFS